MAHCMDPPPMVLPFVCLILCCLAGISAGQGILVRLPQCHLGLNCHLLVIKSHLEQNMCSPKSSSVGIRIGCLAPVRWHLQQLMITNRQS